MLMFGLFNPLIPNCPPLSFTVSFFFIFFFLVQDLYLFHVSCALAPCSLLYCTYVLFYMFLLSLLLTAFVSMFYVKCKRRKMLKISHSRKKVLNSVLNECSTFYQRIRFDFNFHKWLKFLAQKVFFSEYQWFQTKN